MNFPGIQLLMSDIDGTVLNDQHLVDENLSENIQRLKAKEIPFVLASARSPLGMFPLTEELDIGKNPIVCYNGALILEGTKNSYRTINEHLVEQEEAKLVLKGIKKYFPQVSINLYSGKQWLTDKWDKWVDIEASITNETPKEHNLQTLLLEENVSIHKLLLVEEAEVIQALYEFLQSLKLKHSSFYLSKDNYLELTSKEVSKERALNEIVKHYGISLTNTMAIGDNFNDIPMLALAGIGVAMGNAPQKVKESADVITCNNNEHGASQAIRDYVL
ncbi:Cof-type HAD-IIB family hydrolase [Tetragenococcus halophilus]|uniref:Cof-type HAD-IIB family hydrolase n=1 Tax=Tetragenococcus halophilus TaxID=51669 RepID=UPI0020951B25|nr:Cof-type HAD-IIB family hydrolase [Tetragenococcus halophilus]MCO7027172.1 Cof-type HAD-IIB family hydrolase [Tetragenococcus halophilus]